MTDTDISAWIQERIGQLCREFHLMPTMGAIFRWPVSTESVPRRCTVHLSGSAGTVSGRPPPPAHQPAASVVPFASPRARLGRPSSTIGCLSLYANNWTIWPRAASCDHGVNVLDLRSPPAPARTHALCALATPPGGSRPLRPLRAGLPPGSRTCWPPSGTSTCTRQHAQTGQLRLPAPGRRWATCPRCNEESEVLFTLIAERYERRSLGITSIPGLLRMNASSPTPWPPRPPSTGWCTTPSSSRFDVPSYPH